MDYINQIRPYKVQAVYTAIVSHFNANNQKDAVAFATYVEYIVYNRICTLKTNQSIAYHTYIDSVIGLFKDKDDFASICQKLEKKEITYDDLIEGNIIQLFPHKYKKQIARLEQRASAVKTTNLYKCGKCGNRKCTTHSVQLRKSDEGNSTNITCTECLHTWTING